MNKTFKAVVLFGLKRYFILKAGPIKGLNVGARRTDGALLVIFRLHVIGRAEAWGGGTWPIPAVFALGSLWVKPTGLPVSD